MSKGRIVGVVIIFILAITWMVFIFKLSSMEALKSGKNSKDIIAVFLEEGLEFTNDLGITSSHPSESKIEHAASLLNSPLRKVMHASIYFVLAFIIILGINIILKNKKYLLIALITLFICIGFAITDEYHQTFVKGRTGKVLDVFIDTLGSVSGILFYGTYYLAYNCGKKSEINLSIVNEGKVL